MNGGGKLGWNGGGSGNGGYKCVYRVEEALAEIADWVSVFKGGKVGNAPSSLGRSGAGRC